MGLKGCWTCRERKVRCDSQLPRCNNCIKSKRVCKGYGIQLSWPRKGDRKRAIISRDPRNAVSTLHTAAGVESLKLLHSSSWDISLSEELLGNGRTSARARHLRTMKVPRPTYLPPVFMSREESHLLEFFHESRSLMLGPTDEEPLTQFILKVAFSEPSDATSNSVLQSVFALASLQLSGPSSSKNFRYKQLAVSSIASKTIDWLDEKTLLQNLMTTMLLYHYELSLGSNSQGTWVIFLCAVKRIINTIPSIHKLIRQEYSVFLDWIFYHEVMAEFTVRHWKVPYDGCGFTAIPRSPRAVNEVVSKQQIIEDDDNDNIGCPTDVLQLIVHACEHALTTSPPSQTNSLNARMERTNMLEQNILRAAGGQDGLQNIHLRTTTPLNRDTMISDLHRLASLIYANRAFHHITETDLRHRRLVREGISLLTDMVTCQNAWPLFIIACEANDDAQRLAILAVFEQTQQDKRRRSSHIHLIQYMVEAMWKQYDLDTENQVDYLVIMDAVVGALPFMPVFA